VGDWGDVARAVAHRRVVLGHETQKDFVAATGFKLRTLTDIEGAARPNGGYTPSTIARLETALSWPAGKVQEILSGAPDHSRSNANPFHIAYRDRPDDDDAPVLAPRTGAHEGTLDRLAAEITEMLARRTALTVGEVDRLAVVLNAVVSPYREVLKARARDKSSRDARQG